MTIAASIAARTVVGVEHVAGLGPCWEWDGSHNEKGYARIGINGARLYVHRLVYAAEHGTIPADLMVDHRCHNTGCVRGSHLRLLTSGENTENRSGPTRASSTGVRGVTIRRGRFMVQAQRHGVNHYGGDFTTIEEAERAAIALREQIGMTA